MTKARPVKPSATIRMMAAVPTTRPVSVSAVWTGCVRNRWTAVWSVSDGSTVGSDSLALAGKRHADAVRQRDGARREHGVAFREPARDLDVGQTDQPGADVAAARAAALRDEDETMLAVPIAEHRRPRHGQGALLLADDDLDVDGRVGRQRQLRIRDLADHLAHLTAARLGDSGRDGQDAALPAPVGKAVEGHDDALSDGDARQVRLVDADPDPQMLRVGDARDELPG